MAQGPSEGLDGHLGQLRDRLAAIYTQLPAALVTALAAALSDPPRLIDPDAPEDTLQECATSLLSDLISTYIAGDDLAFGSDQSGGFPALSEVSFALCNVVSNPALGKRNSEEAKSDGFDAGNASLFPPAPPQGKSKTLPPWCVGYLHGKPSQHEARLADEIKGGARKLGQNQGRIAVSRDVDFGIQRAAPQTSPEQNDYGLPIAPNVPRYFRTVLISNQGSSEVILFDIRALPEMKDKLRLHDDFDLAGNNSEKSAKDGKLEKGMGVSLAPGAEYQVAVELRCIPQDAAHLQQWLLLSFVPASIASAALEPAKHVFVIGRRISAVIAKSLADIQTLLSVEAIPFFPASLRTLFDTPPTTFLVGQKPALLASTRLFNLLATMSPPPAYKQSGALSYEPESLFAPGPTQDVALWQPLSAKTSGEDSKTRSKGDKSTIRENGIFPSGQTPPGFPTGAVGDASNQPVTPFSMPTNPAFNQQPNPFFGSFPAPDFGQLPNQQPAPFMNQPMNFLANPPQPLNPQQNQFFNPFFHQPNPPPNTAVHQPFIPPLNQAFGPQFPSQMTAAANQPLNPSYNQQFPPLGSLPNPPHSPSAALGFSPRAPPMSPPQLVPAMEIQQLTFWLNAQIAHTLEQFRFSGPQHAWHVQETLRASAHAYFDNYVRERQLQMRGGAPPRPLPPPHFSPGQGPFPPSSMPGPFTPVLGEGQFTPGLGLGALPAQPVPFPTPLPASPSSIPKPGSGVASSGGLRTPSPQQTGDRKSVSGPGGPDLASELGLPHDLSPEPGGVERHWGFGGGCGCGERQLRQLSRLLAMEETAMEKHIKAHDLYNVRLTLQAKAAPGEPALQLFALEVPGLPENRPSVLYADVVYLRVASAPQVEYAAFVWAVEMRPSPHVLLAIAKDLPTAAKLPVKKTGGEKTPAWARALAEEAVHARFTFDRLLLKRMHLALAKAALAPFPLLPCVCSRDSPRQSISPRNLDNAPDADRRKWSPPPALKSSSPNGLQETRDGGPDPDWADSFAPINVKLNRQQRQAVGSLLEGAGGRGPYIIFGPPGTGKTVTMVEMCLQLLQKGFPAPRRKARLCVCAPSNFAADLVCSGIAAGGIGTDVMWRLNDPRRTLASVKADVVSYCKYDAATGLFALAAAPSSYRVIVCTCGAAALLQEPPLADTAGAFTHILIDEAGQALVAETLIAFGLAREDTELVLCGDPRQLGPVVHSPVAAQHGLAQSLLEWYMKAAEREAETPTPNPSNPEEPAPAAGHTDILQRMFPKENNGPASAETSEGAGSAEYSHRTHVVKLVHNYRSHRKLLELPSRMFYKDELVATAEEAMVEPPRNWDEMQGSDFPMLFYGVRGQQMREGEAPSYFNPLEAERLVNLLAGLLQRGNITTADVGVMAPYRKQVQKLRLLLRARGLGAVRVGTVDDYQGQEERVIFISTVLTRPRAAHAGAKTGPDGSIGFLGNAKRFNVAITRAKALLVVVARRVPGGGVGDGAAVCAARGGRLDGHGGGGEEGEYEEGDDDIAEAVGRIAELSLLGMGDLDRQFPEGLDSQYSAFSEDLEWRVVL
ncbi:Silencing defective protein SDE3 [Klebsormidium nitens]|uniref:RNA helicase n=1 Tax=Klebsormidium nitens TaxID=105231 RepID=A0A1Y1HVN9_KLENI|nr:Silencing defective protein SDE3 [Klebsormidium nitens]|eukprot:GAQ82685.1 Silencing defective protein SDE3 [Klebsormidium nitens]